MEGCHLFFRSGRNILWRMHHGAPQKHVFLWRTTMHAPQNVAHLNYWWSRTMFSVAHNSACATNKLPMQSLEGAPPNFCGASGWMRHRKVTKYLWWWDPPFSCGARMHVCATVFCGALGVVRHRTFFVAHGRFGAPQIGNPQKGTSLLVNNR